MFDLAGKIKGVTEIFNLELSDDLLVKTLDEEYKRLQKKSFQDCLKGLEYCKDWKSNWKTRRFKEVATGLGYQVNPGRDGGRYQRKKRGLLLCSLNQHHFYKTISYDNL